MKRKAEPTRPVRPYRAVKKDPAAFMDSVREGYDPDAEFRPKLTKALVPQFFAALMTEDSKKKLPNLVESARIIEVNRFGAYRVRMIETSNAFRKALTESRANKSLIRKIVESGIKLREASTFSKEDRAALKKMTEGRAGAKFREDFDIAPNTNNNSSNPFDEYIPIMGGPFNHQLYLHDMLDALAKAFEAWNHNPIAHRIVKLTTDFVLGRGVTFKARDPLVQTRFMLWWKANEMDSRLEYWSDMISRDGELMIRKFKNPATREMFLRWVDPSTIWEIVTDLEDTERVFYYHQQYPTAYQVLYGSGPDKKFDPTNFGSSKYVINQIPAEEMIHVRINCSPNEKRGRSDLFSILGWLKRYKDFQTGKVLRAIIQSTFAWKNKLKGDSTDVEAFISAFGTEQPEFGSVYVENESSDLTPMTADVGAAGAENDCPGVVNAICSGSGISKEQLLLSDGSGTRATAVVASEPGVKKFQSRQQLMGRVLTLIADEWFKNEIANGTIKKSQPDPEVEGAFKPTDGTIEFDFPEIAVEDRTAKIKDLQTAKDDKVIGHKRFASAVAKELGIEGYEYDKEQEEIAEDEVNAMSSLYPPAEDGSEPDPKDPKGKPSGGLGSDEKRDIRRDNRR